MSKEFVFFILFIFPLLGQAQITLIPDPIFEQHLIDQGIDSDGVINGQVLTSDIEDETFLVIFERPLLQDLTGIEDFSNLEALSLFRVNVSHLDLSQNLNLEYLSIDDLSLESLDLSSNTSLQELYLTLNLPSGTFNSELSSLDVTQNLQLFRILVVGTKIESLDLSENNQLNRVNLQFQPFLTQVNLQNGNNENIMVVEIMNDPLIECIQVDDPLAVQEGNPPYEMWFIDNLEALSDDCFVLNILENDPLKSFVFPNPAEETLHIMAEKYDIDGISLFSSSGVRLNVTFDYTNNTLDVSMLAQGMYIVEFRIKERIIQKKFIKK